MPVPTNSTDQYYLQVPDQYWLPTPSQVIIRGITSIMPVPADSTGRALLLNTRSVPTANSQPSYHWVSRQYYASIHADISPVPCLYQKYDDCTGVVPSQ